ncbi:MAG TPA: NAD-dependent epimerase/dehydratase family protein, partial [Phnomibacter sp.]|nr:NAD-dependent epimerase/dehydratase family protein [Phnomibacter sp.]
MQANSPMYILVTGAAGFIGSCVARQLNQQGYQQLILADDFGREDKRQNWEGLDYAHLVERYHLEDWL